MATSRFGALVILGWTLALAVLLAPATQAQGEPTATPDAEGVIYSQVRPNDSLWSVAARAGINLQTLLSLNNLSETAIIHPGQLLIVGYGTPPPTATVEPTVTTTRPPPTATATGVPPPRTAICLTAFHDINRNGVYDSGEPLKAAVAFTLFNEQAVVGNHITDGASEPFCFEELAPGDYQVTRSIAHNEALTTAGDWALAVSYGNVLNLHFGSYTREETSGVEPAAGAPANVAATMTPAAAVVQPAPAAPENSQVRAPRRDLLIGAAVLVVLLLLGVIFTVVIRHRNILLRPGKRQ